MGPTAFFRPGTSSRKMDEGELEALEGVIIRSMFKRAEIADRGRFEGHVSRVCWLW